MTRRLVSLAALVVLAWLGMIWLGRGDDGAAVAIAKIAQANGAKVAAAYRAGRAEAAEATARAERAEAQTSASGARVAQLERALALFRDSARTLIADTGATRDALRAALSRSVALSDRLVNEASRYRADVDSLLEAFRVERQRTALALALADSTIAAKDRAIDAWRAAARPLPWWKRAARAGCTAGVAAGGGALGSEFGRTKGAAIGALAGVLVGAVACR